MGLQPPRTSNIVGVAPPTLAGTPPIFTAVLRRSGEKFVPVIATRVPAQPSLGAKAVMVGGTTIVKTLAVVTDLPPTSTLIVPVTVPGMIVIPSVLVVAESTVAGVPPTVTRLSAGVAENPDPPIVTWVPTGPMAGVNDVMVTPLEPEDPQLNAKGRHRARTGSEIRRMV